MYQSHDMHHEPHHIQYPHPSMPTQNSHIRNNHIYFLNGNHNFNVKWGIRFDMGKIQDDKMNKRVENNDLEMD